MATWESGDLYIVFQKEIIFWGMQTIAALRVCQEHQKYKLIKNISCILNF